MYDLCLVARTEAEAWFLVKVSSDIFIREGDLVKLEDEEEFFTVMEVSSMYDKAAEKMLMEAYDMAEVEKLYKVSWEVECCGG